MTFAFSLTVTPMPITFRLLVRISLEKTAIIARKTFRFQHLRRIPHQAIRHQHIVDARQYAHQVAVGSIRTESFECRRGRIDRATMAEPDRIVTGHIKPWQRIEEAIDRTEQRVSRANVNLTESIERNRLVEAEATRRGSPQSGQMRATAERRAQIGGQRADVRALAANDIERRDRARPLDQRENLHLDAARRPRYLDAFARVVVVAAALELERRMCGRRLLQLAGEYGQCGLDVRSVE